MNELPDSPFQISKTSPFSNLEQPSGPASPFEVWQLEFPWRLLRVFALTVASGLLCAAAEPTPPAGCQGFDEAAGVLRNAPWHAGMPLGGIGCGKFELLPSGWFGRFTINHNWDMPLWEDPFVPSRGTFLAVSVRDGVQRVTRWLRRGWPESELAGARQVRNVEFRGTFPFAEVAFVDETLPARVSLRAWSPLIPHNIKDSSLPVAFFELTLENPLDRPLEASALMSLENFVGIGGVRVREGKQRWYFADGDSQQPVVISSSTLQGLRFRSPRRFEGIGRNVSGEYLLLADGPTTDRGWDALGDGHELVEEFRARGELNGLAVRASEDKVRAAGALCRKFQLAPHTKQTVYFVLVWWMPDHVTLDLKNHGHFYQRAFRDSEKLAAYAFDQRERLARETDAWARLLRESNLPAWLKSPALNAAGAMFSNTLLTRDGEFAMQENPGRGEGALGALETRWASGAFCRTFFPELDRRELELFRACQQPTGEVPRLCGNLYHGIGSPDFRQGITGRPEPACVYIMEALAHYRATGDRKFLDEFWPGVKQAFAWAARTHEPAAWSFGGAATRAVAAMARIENEPELARDCEKKVPEQHPPWNEGHSLKSGIGQATAADILPAAFLADLRLARAHGATKTTLNLARQSVLENARRIYEVVCRYNKNPWGWPAGVDVTFKTPPAIREGHLTGMAAWAALDAVTGAALDVPGRRLALSPRLPAEMTELHTPVFFTRFWAWLDFGPKEFRLKIVRHSGEPLELRELAADTGGVAIKLPEPFVARTGASLDLSPWRDPLCKAGHAPSAAHRETLSWTRDGSGTLSWSATSSGDEPFPPTDAFDGFRETRWETIAQGRTSDWFQLDLGEVQEPKRIEMETTPGAQLRVEYSIDGSRWRPLLTTPGPLPAGTNGLWKLDWTAGPVQLLKFAPARDMNQQWQIRELWVK